MKNINNYQNQNKGFTLFEILIAITIGIVLLVLLLSVYSLSVKSLNIGLNKAELTQDARVITERITRDIRESRSIATLLPPNKNDEQNPPPNEIELRDGHNDILQYIYYYLSGTDLRRQIKRYYFSSNSDIYVPFDAEDDFGNPPEINIISDDIAGQYIQNIIFYGDNTVNMEITIQKNNTIYTTKTSAYGRNL